MNPDMLTARENVLNDYIKLFEVLNDNVLVKDALTKKYISKKYHKIFYYNSFMKL